MDRDLRVLFPNTGKLRVDEECVPPVLHVRGCGTYLREHLEWPQVHHWETHKGIDSEDLREPVAHDPHEPVHLRELGVRVGRAYDGGSLKGADWHYGSSLFRGLAPLH